MINPNFVILGAILSLIGSSGYAYDTFRGLTKPNRITWFLWASAPLIAFFAELSEGVGIHSLMTFMVGFGPAIVLVASFFNRKSYWEITKFDMICGALSVLGLILWFITRTGNIAILFAIFADGLAALPTVRKSIKNPESESWNVFFFASLNAAITLLAIKEWNFANYAFPIYIFVICVLLFVLIFRKQGLQLVKVQEN